MELPTDLVPIPTQPWDVRPIELPLDADECRTALWMAKGNITEAAVLLKVSSKRLRKFVNGSEYLLQELEESKEQLIDTAEKVVLDALTDDQDKGRKDSMARFVLGSGPGRRRGYGTGSGGSASLKLPGAGRMVITWEDGENITGQPGDDAKLVEGETVDG